MTTAYAEVPQFGAWDHPKSDLPSSETDAAMSATAIEGLPIQLVETYARAASGHARVREVDPNVWVASVVGLDGAWAEGSTAQEAVGALPAAIMGWVAVKLRTGATDIPIIEGFDMNPRGSE